MCADIHDGQEHKRSAQGPDTEAQDQSSPDLHIRLATHGRSIQRCQKGKSRAAVKGERRAMSGLSQTSDVGRVGAPSGPGLEPEIELRARERSAPQWFTLPNL